jgi:hypothetical protein
MYHLFQGASSRYSTGYMLNIKNNQINSSLESRPNDKEKDSFLIICRIISQNKSAYGVKWVHTTSFREAWFGGDHGILDLVVKLLALVYA